MTAGRMEPAVRDALAGARWAQQEVATIARAMARDDGAALREQLAEDAALAVLAAATRVEVERRERLEQDVADLFPEASAFLGRILGRAVEVSWSDDPEYDAHTLQLDADAQPVTASTMDGDAWAWANAAEPGWLIMLAEQLEQEVGA